jgi:two-component system chemotaxis sensor kinase CheA
MSIDLDDDILQDFLVEAGEILEQLNEQLVDLEQNPEDQDLLNAVFRGFHTVKGGAGFLGLNPLVDVCHSAEDVFNVLRQGGRIIDAPLMDVVLRALDAVNSMFLQVQSSEQLTPADPALIAELERYLGTEDAVGESLPVVAEQPPADDPVARDVEELLDVAGQDSALPAGGGDITEEEFETLLDALHGKGRGPCAESDPQDTNPPPSGGDDISEAEFEQLLDALHGDGKAPVGGEAPGGGVAEQDDDTITEQEFEQLLDDLHGKGKAPSPSSTAATDGPAAADPAAVPATAKPNAQTPSGKEQKSTPAQAQKVETSVRVDTKRLDDIMNLVGELVLARNRLTSLRDSFENEKVTHAVSALDLVTADLQGAVMKTRMQPIKKVYGRFPRVVRDLARSLRKEVELQLVGEETDLDKNLVEALADPLVHLVRNAVDHGIEAPDLREAAGKPRHGTVVLSAEQAGDHILLTIKDDGAGMDADALREMAVRKGVMDAEAAARLNEKECFELIFLPGTSTKTEISDVSGRGVGMDVVKTRISQLNGMIDIDSTPGTGTALTIKVPLTLAILPTLMVVLGKRKFALPLSVISEIFELSQSKTNVVDGQTVVQVRGKAPPLFRLREWLLQHDELQEQPENPQVVMVNIGNRAFGLVVDQVIGQEEVVIKPLGAMLQGLPGLSGATITGDGNIALILDVPGLLRAYATRH